MRARPTRFFLARLAATVTAAATVAAGLVATAPTASAASVVTPGDFTGFGFDQCVAPTQKAMDAWLRSSPFWAVGIYTSGASRACTSQPNLTPTWVSTQLANGWRLLPITLGPQASCTTRSRYLRQERINPRTTGSYAAARAQGSREADRAIDAAQRLGIGAGSTLWYDLEAFSTSNTTCRESALSFLSSWTDRLRARDYVSGVYSSAASGIKMLDQARAYRPGAYTMPDQLWIADWNGRADVFSSYLGNAGWMPHKRVHQYRGGHNETHGGVTINIDSNWLDLGRGSQIAAEPKHCGGAASYNHGSFPTRRVGSTGAHVSTLQCLLRAKKVYTGAIDGIYDAELGEAVRSYRVSRGLTSTSSTGPAGWMAILTDGDTPLLKYGAASTAVRRLQRGLNAADSANLTVTGVFEGRTTAAVKRYQSAHGLRATGVVESAMWSKLLRGIA